MTKLTIVIDDYSLKELKEIYRRYYELPKSERITKESVANWVGNLAHAEIESNDFLYSPNN